MPKNKNKQAIQRDSWKRVLAILGSVAVLVGTVVSGLDFITAGRVSTTPTSF